MVETIKDEKQAGERTIEGRLKEVIAHLDTIIAKDGEEYQTYRVQSEVFFLLYGGMATAARCEVLLG